MINVSFNLSEVTMDELIGLQAMLTAYDRAALRTQIKRQQFETVSNKLGEPNARMRPSVKFDSAALDMADHLGVAPLPDGPVEPECPLFAGCPETPQTGCPITATAVLAGQAAGMVSPEAKALGQALNAVVAPMVDKVAETLGHIPAEPMVPKRKRRTKEQMEADELAAACVKNPDDKLSEVAADPIQAGPVTPPSTPPSASGPATSPEVSTSKSSPASAVAEPTGDDLRAALKVYSKTHGMPKAIELIKDFDCERISELETKPLADRLEFMKLAQNA